MDWIRILWSPLRRPFPQQRLDEDLDDELRSHIDFAIEETAPAE